MTLDPTDLRAAARDVMLANGFQPDFPPAVQLEVAQLDAVVTGVKEKATYVQLEQPVAEGRLVRGWKGLRPGDSVRVVLLAADPEKGFIDFARDES